MTCTSCEKSKSTLHCGVCQAQLCKSCAEFLSEDSFAFLLRAPQDFAHGVYCAGCFAEKIAPQLAAYEQTLEQAKNILVFNKSQGKETRLIKRIEKPVHVKDCADENEAVMKLAFAAAQANYNAIIDVNLIPQKVRTGSYQTTIWSGSGVPAHVQSERLVKDRSLWQNPN